MARDLAAAVDHDRTMARVASIRHVRTTCVPIDETCFSLFEAKSIAMLQEANDRFKFGYRRVSAVIELESFRRSTTQKALQGDAGAGGGST